MTRCRGTVQSVASDGLSVLHELQKEEEDS
jgi:hypothetical protein